MLKYVAPLERRLRSHLGSLPTLPARAHPPAVTPRVSESPDDATFGQRLAEHTAAGIGSWRFIIAQAVVFVLWIAWNTIGPYFAAFDRYPFTFLNLAMSAEAAFTGPILLIAAIVGAIRDHRQYDRIEHLVAQNEAMAERIATLETTILARLDTLPKTSAPRKAR